MRFSDAGGIPMRWTCGGYKPDLGEVQAVSQFFGHAQMAEVDGVECPTKDAYRLQLSAYLPVAQHDVLLAGEAFQTDRATCVDLVGRNADLRAQAVFEAIGKARRGVDHD